MSASSFEVGARYRYSVCVKVKSKRMYSPVGEFVVQHPYSEPRSYDSSEATDLSSEETANCYVISQSGLYKFKAAYGNSGSAIPGVASAQIVWESFGTSVVPEFFALVEGVCYKDGYVVLKTPSEFVEGNALVAVMDVDGNILWSWHIWLTDAPAAQVYYNDAGTMMDRNLGATSATPGDIGAHGLFYQWGRKDPFLGSSSNTSGVKAKSTITWPAAEKSDSYIGSMEYAVSHPTTYIQGTEQNYDWYFTDCDKVDLTRWPSGDVDKSVYDPCPAGWRLPEGGSDGVWCKALGITSSKLYTMDSVNKGMQMGGILGDDENIWYPAAGNLDHAKGSFLRVGTAGVCWTVTNYKAESFQAMCGFWNNGRFYAYDYGARARAFSVRCIKE